MSEQNELSAAVIITGPVGIGKSTTGVATCELLSERGVGNALVDMDYLRWAYPAPPGDPFHEQVGFRNLAAVGANYIAVGANHLVVITVVETAAMLEQYRQALPGTRVSMVRLTAPIPTIHRRIAGRDSGAALDWHQARAIELTALMDERDLQDLLVDTEGKTPAAIAREIVDWLGWAVR